MPAPTIKIAPRIANFSENPMYLVLESSKYTGSEGPYTPTHPNLSCYIEVWQHHQETEIDEKLATLHVPYNPYTKEAVVDISQLAELYPTLPDFNEQSGSAKNTYAHLWVRFADQWGTPVLPSGDIVEYKNEGIYFNAIYGSSRQTIGNFETLGGFPLHAYKNSNGEFFAKQVTIKQPDWLYFWIPGEGDKFVSVDTELIYDDQTTEDLAAVILPVKGNQVSYVSASYEDRVLPANPSKDVVAFNVKVSAPWTLGYKVILQQKYILDQCTERDIYLAYFNGLGGIESVRMYGKSSSDYSATKDIIERTQYGAIDDEVGQVDFFNQLGQEEFNFNTGYYTEDYIYHLRQFLLSKTWLIDIDRNRFKAIVPTSVSIKEVKHNDRDLFFIPMKYIDPRRDPFANLLHAQTPS